MFFTLCLLVYLWLPCGMRKSVTFHNIMNIRLINIISAILLKCWNTQQAISSNDAPVWRYWESIIIQNMKSENQTKWMWNANMLVSSSLVCAEEERNKIYTHFFVFAMTILYSGIDRYRYRRSRVPFPNHKWKLL